MANSTRFLWSGKPRSARAVRRDFCRLEIEYLEPRLAPASTHFAVIGDYGYNTQAERDVSNLVKSWSPDYVLTVGDNNYWTGQASTIDANVGQYYSSYIGNYKGSYGTGSTGNRFFPTLGDHDWGYAYPNPTGDQPYLNYFTLPGNERYYTFTQGPIQFFALDSDGNEPAGSDPTSVQGNWLKAQLAASTATYKIVYFAATPYSSTVNYDSTWMRWPFQAWGATAVLAGHAHTYERLIEDNNFPYFVNGLGGEGEVVFDKVPPEVGSQVRYNADYGAMLVNADDTHITFQFITRTGTLIDSYTITTKTTMATRLGVNVQPASTTPGSAVNVTVTAQDNAGNTATTYRGTVHFSSSDIKAGLPADYTFAAGDNGQHAFTVTLNTAGSQTVTATDKATATITGSGSVAVAVPFIPRPDHVVILFESYQGYSDIIGNSAAPYLNSLATAGASFTNSHGISAFGEPNYLGLFSGSTQGVVDNGTYTFTAPNLGQSLLSKGLTFGGYAESMPSVGYTGDVAAGGLYQRYHNPWVNFSSVPAAANMPFTSFPTNYALLPTVSFVVPNFSNDMHDGTIAAGDTWAKTNIDAYAQWAKTHNSLLIVTWDHDTGTPADQIPTLFVGQMVKTGTYTENISHYNVLRTVEDMYGLPYLSQDASVASITDAWSNAPPAAPIMTAGATGTGTINLTWTNSGNATGFQIQRSTDGVNFLALASVGPGVLAYSDTGLAAGTQYYYRVLASSAAGNSPFSNVVNDFARGAATHFALTAPSTAATGSAIAVSITALDAFNRTATGYTGSVRWSSSDPKATLPADYTFSAADNSTHSFSITLNTPGSQTVTVTDKASATVTGNAALVASAPVAPTIPRPDHVVILFESYQGYSDIIGNSAAPYLNSLATAGASFTNSHGISAFGEPNYLGLFSGSTQGVVDNGTYTFTAPNLGQSLISKGLTFGGYAESMPSVGYTGDVAAGGLYQRYHNPWVNFSSVPAAANMPFTSFPTNYALLPTVSFVVPNFSNDMHDGTIAAGDTWAKTNIDAYAQWAKTHNSLLIITWDHDTGTPADQIPTLFVGQMVKTGTYTENISHYNVLRTVEDMYGLPYLSQDASVASITDAWTN